MQDQSVGSAAALPAISERQRSLAFITVLTGLVLEVADSTIVNTALPAIRAALHASPQEMQWIVAGYLLALGSLMLLGGKLGDAYGHARVFLWGVTGFILGSALCGMAQDPLQLVLARVIQGAAAAIMAPQTMAVVQLLYTPLERVKRLAYFGLILGLAAIIGPVLGGTLIEMDVLGLGWRTIFLINVPIGLAVILLGGRVLPRAEELAPPQIDPAGALLFTASFAGLLYPLIEAAEKGWSAPLAALALGGLALLLFAWQRARRRRARDLASVVEPSLFTIPTFRWATWAGFGFAAASMGFLLVFAVSLQQGLGLSALDTALVHIPFGAGVMSGVGFMVPRLLPRFGKAVPVVGGVLMIAGTALSLGLIAAGRPVDALLLVVLALAGVGMGLLQGPLGPIVVAQVPREHAGTASATFRTGQQIGGAGGIALVGAAYFSVAGSDAASSLAGARPAALVVAILLLWAIFSVSRLPRTLFTR